jgi:hypothetical protein
MKTKGIVIFLSAVLTFGVVAPAAGQTAFAAAKVKALDLHRSLIGFAAPQVRGKITASAQAVKSYLAQCGRGCDLEKFSASDLGNRFGRLSDSELSLLKALVFSELVGDSNRMDNIEMQDNLQAQQQFIQTILTIMKSQNDTLMEIIRKLRG